MIEPIYHACWDRSIVQMLFIEHEQTDPDAAWGDIKNIKRHNFKWVKITRICINGDQKIANLDV